MTILVVGGGGREHAIVKKLKENKSVSKIYAAPGNGGIAQDAVCLDIGACECEKIVQAAKDIQADLVVVAPDDPLVLGLVDLLEENGIRAFGPNKAAAIIEGSKAFSKQLMKKYNIPTAGYEIFDDAAKALEYIRRQDTYPTVIKADGLALGKGVIIAESYQQAADAVHSIMEDKIFGSSGNQIVIEEFLTGPEVSVLAFTDSKTIVPMISSMDHKRALDGDKGLNTGGMGTVAPNPYYTPDIAAICQKEIFDKTMHAMNAEGRPFKGCLYFGLMLTPNGPKVIEYNCRFGDPETQVVLPLLNSDLLDIFQAIIDEKLADVPVLWKAESAACVILASGGYPAKYEKLLPINGLDEQGQIDGATVFHAGTAYKDNCFLTNGGRVLGVTATAETLRQALQVSYAATDKITFQNCHRRNDIGQKALQALVQKA